MVDKEGLRLETELEIMNVEVEIKEKEIEIFRNANESIICKEAIEKNVPEDEIEYYLSGNYSNHAYLTSNIRRMGVLTFKNLALEDEKFSLISYKEDLQEQLRKIEEGVKFK